MEGHEQGPSGPHVPEGVAPLIGFQAMRERQRMEEQAPGDPGWPDPEDYRPWSPGHRPLVKVTATVLSILLVVAGLSTVLEIVLYSH